MSTANALTENYEKELCQPQTHKRKIIRPRTREGQRDKGRIAQVVRSLPYKCKAPGYDAREAGTPRGFQPKQRLDRALPEPAVHGVATAREGGQDRRTEEATRQEQTDGRKPTRQGQNKQPTGGE